MVKNMVERLEFPEGFFTKSRPEATEEPLADISEPMQVDEDVLNGKKFLFLTTEKPIKKQAVEYLDAFTKTYCIDESVQDDLVFRCKDCEFEMQDGTCLVKVMAHKLCPDYKDFGSMGDL